MSDYSITVWRFQDAPKEFQEMSINGGDEDWVVLIPAAYRTAVMPHGWLPEWMTRIDTCLEPDQVELSNGDLLLIGAH